MFFSINSFVKIQPQLWPHCTPLGSWIEQTYIYPTWECFHAKYSFSGQWYLRRFFENSNQVFIILRNFPFKDDVTLHFKKKHLESPSPKYALCQIVLKLGQWLWKRSRKCKKFKDGETDRETDRRIDASRTKKLSEKLTWAFSPGELKRGINL